MIPKIESMETPSTRGEFEYRFHHLVEAIKKGRIHFPSNFGESLFKLRKLPNGRLDLLSIDESARLQANMMLQMSKIKLEPGSGNAQEPPHEEQAPIDPF